MVDIVSDVSSPAGGFGGWGANGELIVRRSVLVGAPGLERDIGTAVSPDRLWTPSDITGATDMTSELEAFVAANQGYQVTLPDNAIIKLKNAFKLVTTGHIDIDFGNATIVYDSNTSADAAIYADNTSNADGEKTVNSLATATVNDDATVTQLTLATTSTGNRFDWFAFYSTNANPAKSGGFLGEIVQLLADEASLVLTCTRKLNRHAEYSTGMAVRRLDASRKLHIKGGTFTANGNPESHSITARCDAIVVQGFVDPLVEDVIFDAPWSRCLRFRCNAAPKWRNITVKDIGNLATYNGFIYGVLLDSMNDGADGRGIVVRNGRHAGFTTDGNSSSTTTWYLKGIPTNFVVDGVHGYNCHGSLVDTHEEGDGGHISNVHGYHTYQDADISPNFTGVVVQARCARTRYSNIHCYGGTNGIKVAAIDHGFENPVHLSDIFVHRTTQGSGTDNDIGINISDQSALTNKCHVYLDNARFTDVGECIFLGKTAKLTLGDARANGCDTWIDHNPGSIFVATGTVALDYRNNARTAAYRASVVRSDGTYGGATVIYLRKPIIIKGDAANKPSYFFEEQDTTASKTIWAPGITEYNPSATTTTQLYKSGATTFALANVNDATNRQVRVHTAAGAATLNDTDDILVINKSSGAATVVNLPNTAIANRRYTIKDGKGDANTNNITLTPAAGNIDGAATKVMNLAYGSYDIVHNGTEWNIIGGHNEVSAAALTSAPFALNFNARADSSTSLTNMAAAAAIFPLDSKRAIRKFDLTNYTQARLIVNVATGATIIGKLVAKYKTSLIYATVVATDFSDLGTSEISCSVVTAGVIDSGWINLAAGAKADVFIVPITIDGTGALTPAVGAVDIEFK